MKTKKEGLITENPFNSSNSSEEVFVVFDKTDVGFHKPFDSIHKTEITAKKRVEELQLKIYAQLGKDGVFYKKVPIV